MSMKMSVAAVEFCKKENNISYTDAAIEPKLKVITVSNLRNPFTFDDVDQTEEFIPSHNQMQQTLIISIAFIAMFIIASFVQSCIHEYSIQAIIKSATTEEIIVRPGETLWDIASRNCHGKMNVSEFIYYISEINNLEGATLVSGQSLNVPVL